MKRPTSSTRALFVLCTLIGAGLSADVVLHPGTLTGTTGISGWTASGGSVYVANGSFSGSQNLATGGTFSLTLEGNQTYTTESVTQYYLNSTAYLGITESQTVTLPVGGTASVDLRRPGATVNAAFQVTGGTFSGWTPTIYGSVAGGDQFSLNVSTPVSASVPVEAGVPYHVQGTARVEVANGTGGVLCTATVPFPGRDRPSLAQGAVDTLTDSLVVNALTCASGIAGTAALSGLPAGYSLGSSYLYASGNSVQKDFYWSKGNPQNYSFTLAPGDYNVGGGLNLDGPFTSSIYLPARRVSVTAGATTRHDITLDSVLASGKLSFSGPVGAPSRPALILTGGYDSTLPFGGPTAGATVYLNANAAGAFAGITYAGNWRPLAVSGSYDNVSGDNQYSSFYLYDVTQPPLTAVAGSPLAVPDRSIQLSTGSIVFDVVEPAGAPEVGISYPSVNAYTSDATHSYSVNGSANVVNVASPSVRLIGPAGHYTFSAYATVQGSSIRFASSTIDLGTAVDTPPGTDVIIIPKDSAGNPTPLQLDFKTVTIGGSTTVSTTDVGPGAPIDYNLLAVISGKQYININTSATFPGKIEIGLRYDPAALGISAAQEQRLVLQQYLCNGTACSWVPINEVYNPHNPTYTDADARYFGRSNLANPDLINHVIYGVTTSLGTFGLTYPKVVLVPPTDSCIGSAAGPAQLTTDAKFCSATVDNVNKRAGGCSGGGGGLASCLFDGAASETLALGPHSVAIVGKAVDGSSASCTSYVTVADREPPAIACPAPVTLECTGPQTPYTARAVCADNCGSCTASCGSGPFAPGPTPLSCNATDTAGNKNSCQTLVTVVDTTAPEVTLVAQPLLVDKKANHDGVFHGNDENLIAVALADCVAAATDRCDGPLAPNTAGAILRVSWLTRDREEGACEAGTIVPVSGHEVKLKPEDDGAYRIDFVVSDAHGNGTPASCLVRFVEGKENHEEKKPWVAPTHCACCTGTGCGSCPAPRPRD